ncbi:MAG: enoyl-CoA hydratase-related protein, partial [Myxococcota bacterium]
MDELTIEHDGPVTVVTLDRRAAKNAVHPRLARAIARAFIEFDQTPSQSVAVLAGAHGTFCAGADLKAVSAGEFDRFDALQNPPSAHDDRAPMGPSYLRLSKPVIAAVSGHAVAGGM